MAPIKRAAQRIFEDESTDASEDDRDASSSASQSGARKRRRTTDQTDQTSIHGNSDVESSPPHSPSLDPDDEDALEQIATQAVQEKYASVRENTPVECGILEEVEVRNFMCHEHCIFKLGPLINFICGKNGSGKSAILTAITLCLGAKATATSRGTSLKTFVKQGKEEALIQVRIKNQGEGAYMHDVYGDTIIVQRHFSVSGASGFILKCSANTNISRKRATLEDICDHFSLQIDNPLNVLSQDAARQFISNSTPSFLYKQFVKGVQLEQLDLDYRVIEERLDLIEAALEAKEPDVKILEQKKVVAQNKQALFDRNASVFTKMQKFRRQLAWVQVRQQEGILAAYVREVADADAKITQFETVVERLSRLSDDARQTAVAARLVEQEAGTAHAEAVAEKNSEQVKYNDIKTQVHEMQAERRSIRSTLQQDEKLIKEKERQIEEEQQRLAERDGGGAAGRLAALEDAKQSVSETADQLAEHRNQRPEVDRAAEDLERVVVEANAVVDEQKSEVGRQQTRLAELNNDRSQRDLNFHQYLPNLLQAIKQERGFTRQPIGPLGKHVRLLKPEWSSVLEKFFGGTLSSFMVTSKGDHDLLQRLMRKTRCMLSVNITNDQTIDTLQYEPDVVFDTPLRVLEIDNEMVKKQLVLHHHADKTILISNPDEASRVLYSGQRPRNVKQCLCIDPRNKRQGYILQYTKSGQASQDPISEYVGQSRMKTDTEAQVRLQREAVDDAKLRQNRLEAEWRAARERHEKAKQAITRHKAREEELKLTAQRAEDEVQRIEEAIGEDNVQGGSLDVLRNGLLSARETQTLHEQAYTDSLTAYDELKAKLEAARLSMAAFDERINELHTKKSETTNVAQDLDKKAVAASWERNEALSSLNDGKNDRNSLDEKRAVKEQDIQDFIAQANEVSPRVNIDEEETEETLKRKFEKLRRDHANFERSVGITKAQAAADAARTAEAWRKATDDFADLARLGAKLKASLIERRARWKYFRGFISSRAKAQFMYLLSERSFRGKLITDHESKLLELSVEPDITKRNGEGRGARTLSGGEKSFSQICLLLAIWEAMGSPIRCLDEFDVYMDAVNRNMSVALLIAAARQSVGRQFVLISPGVKSDIQRAADIHVHELQAPERGQTTLSFGRRAGQA